MFGSEYLLFILMLSIFLGFELINKVPATLHTPLMSGANAISGITVVGAVSLAGTGDEGLAMWLGVVLPRSMAEAEGENEIMRSQNWTGTANFF